MKTFTYNFNSPTTLADKILFDWKDYKTNDIIELIWGGKNNKRYLINYKDEKLLLLEYNYKIIIYKYYVDKDGWDYLDENQIDIKYLHKFKRKYLINQINE